MLQGSRRIVLTIAKILAETVSVAPPSGVQEYETYLQ